MALRNAPKSLLDWVRTQAAAEHVKPTAWIRALIEQRRANETPLADRVSTLETALQALLGRGFEALEWSVGRHTRL